MHQIASSDYQLMCVSHNTVSSPITHVVIYSLVMSSVYVALLVLHCDHFSFVFFFIDTPTTEIYTYCHPLSLHDALPIFLSGSLESQHPPRLPTGRRRSRQQVDCHNRRCGWPVRRRGRRKPPPNRALTVARTSHHGVHAACPSRRSGDRESSFRLHRDYARS